MKIIELTGTGRGIRGYLYGISQPSLIYGVRIQLPPYENMLQVHQHLSDGVGVRVTAPTSATASEIIIWFQSWIAQLQKKANHAVIDSAVYFPADSGSEGTWTLVQPCLDFSACQLAIHWLTEQIDLISPPVDSPAAVSQMAISEGAARLLARMEKSALKGFNGNHFVAAAHELDVPWTRLSGNLIQYGQGASSRLLESSFTDRTPRIGAILARDKMKAAQMLRSAGLPVARHFLAANAANAAEIAGKLGYPVVVKPADLDGGVGVFAHLKSELAVRKAFARTAKHSKRVLVEQHIAGRDYRLQIVDREIQGIIERIPAGVTGNGVDTVADLVAAQNRERKTAVDDRQYLHPIRVDDESTGMLADAAMTWQSIPGPGQAVRLRGAANVASGGIPVPLPVEVAHPDNLALAIRAVDVLRLDVAGVDLLIPDIRVSWLETSASICEVNAQPQMFTTMHKPMLKRILKGGTGRVPVVLVLSRMTDEAVSTEIQRRLLRQFPRAGLACGAGLWVGAQRMSATVKGGFEGGRALVLDPTVEAIVLSVSDLQPLKHGWPVDRCDVLVLLGVDAGATGGRLATLTRLAKSARGLRAHTIITDQRDPDCVAAARMATGPGAVLREIAPAWHQGGSSYEPLIGAAMRSLEGR